MFDMVRGADATFAPFLGVASNTTGSAASTDNMTPVFTLGPNEGYNQGYVQGPMKPFFPPQQLMPQLLMGRVSHMKPNRFRTQYVQEIYLNIQRQLPGDLMLSAGYVHTKGTHLGFQRDLNQVPEALLGPGNAQSKRPYPQFQSISATLFDGRSNYDALQLRAEKRASHGLSLVANYAWQKTMDTGTASGSSTGVDTWQRAYDSKANYGVSSLDLPNMINGMASYQLPFGAGRPFLNTNRPLNQLIGGWQLGAYFQIHGGRPFTPVVGTSNLSNSLAGTWFPNQTSKGTLSNPTIAKWFDVTAFQIPAPYTFGDARRNSLRGPNWRSVDANLGKTFPLAGKWIGEGKSFEARVDVFDLLNHPNLGQPNANIGTAGAGIMSSANTSRNIQLTGRLRF